MTTRTLRHMCGVVMMSKVVVVEFARLHPHPPRYARPPLPQGGRGGRWALRPSVSIVMQRSIVGNRPDVAAVRVDPVRGDRGARGLQW